MKARSFRVRWLLVLVAGAGVWLVLARAWPREHDASDRIVGTPAFRNYSESREKGLYVAAHALAVVCGVIGFAGLRRGEARAETRTPPPDAAEPAQVTRWRRLRRNVTTIALAASIYALFVWVAQFDAHYDGFHEGARLNYAQAALDGKVPYRDFDCVYGLWYGVGQHLLAFQLAGEVSVRAAHRLANGMAPWLPVAMYFVCWLTTRNRLQALAGLGLAALLMFAPPFLIDWPVDHHGFTSRHVWPALLVALMLLYLESRRVWLMGLLGVGLGLAALWPLQSVLVPLAAVLATLVVLPLTEGFNRRQTMQATGWLGAGLAIGLLPLVAYLLSHQALGDFFQYHAKVLRIHASWNGQMFPTPSELMRRHQWSAFDNLGVLVASCGYFYVPVALTLLGCLRLGKPLVRLRFGVEQTRLVCLSVAAFVFFVSTIERSDGHHAAYAALMHVPLLLVLLPRLGSTCTGSGAAPASSSRRLRTPFGRLSTRTMTRTAWLVFAILCVAAPARFIGRRVRNYAARDELRATGLASRYSDLPRLRGIPQLSSRNVQLLREMGRQIDRYTESDDAILDLSDWFTAHFLYNRRAPGRFYYSYDAVSPADQRQIVGQLDATALVILPLDSAAQQPASVDGIPAAVRYHVVMEHLLERFEPYAFPFLLNPRGRRENSGYAVMGPRHAMPAANSAHETQSGPADWMTVAPYEIALGYVPYFGEQLFREAAIAARPERGGRTSGGPVATAIDAVAPAPNPHGRAIYLVHQPSLERPPRLLRVRIACSGDDRNAYLGWTVPNPVQPGRGWRLQFNLATSDEAHAYVFKLASVPQWVWAESKENIFFDLPAGAKPLEAWWE